MSKLYQDGKLILSFEVFPPKTPQGFEALYRNIGELAKFEPGFISITYGAGGSTQQQTLDIVTEVRKRFDLPTTAHFTIVGSTVPQIIDWLAQARDVGTENIMALRGDPPQGQEKFTAVEGGLRYANELVKLIRDEFPDYGVGVAGYPEKHVEAENPEVDLINLKRKVDAGADAVFTQLFYDNEDFFRFRDDCAAIGIERPIIPGLLPVLSLKQVQRITSLCGSKLPKSLLDALVACQDDPEAQVEVGIEHASRQCESLLAAGVPGIHFYVLNRSQATAQILDNVLAK